MPRFIPALILAFLFPCFAPAAAPIAATPDFSPVEAQIQTWLDEGAYPAAGLWIVNRAGETVYERYWNGYTRDTVVSIASASKWLEAATAMTLVDSGELSLDAPISRYLPELTGPAGTNTLRQLLSHTNTLNHLDLPSAEAHAGIDRMPALLAAAPIPAGLVPGDRFQYGGTGLAITSRAIEVVTGKPWLTVFGERIAEPCGLRSTITGANLWTYDRIVGGDNFPCSNAADYMNFLRMILADGVFNGKRVLSHAALHEMQADQVRTAGVKQPAYPEEIGGARFTGVYGFGEWRLVLDEHGEAVVLSSPAYTGFFPWIDKKNGLAGVFVARAKWGVKLNPFTTVPRISQLVSAAFAATPQPK